MCGGWIGQLVKSPVKAIEKGVIRPTGSFIKDPIGATARQVQDTARQTQKFIRNPADALVAQHVRDSSMYRNVARPIAKTGTGIGAGFLTGGIPGAIAGGVGSVAGGSLTNRAFQPTTNLVMPAASGAIAGYLTDSGLFSQDKLWSATAPEAAAQATTQGAIRPDLAGYPTPPAADVAAGATSGLEPLTAAAQPSMFETVKNTAIQAVTGGKDSTFLDQVVKFGPTALQAFQGITGLSASQKELELAGQAQAAAQAGNQEALNNALASLTHQMNLRKGAALARMGASGFITRRSSGGTMLDIIDNTIAANEQLQKKYLRTMSANDAARIDANAASAKARAEAGRMAAFGDLGTAGLRLVDVMNRG